MDVDNTTTSFSASVALVLEEVKNTRELRRSTYTKRLQFAIDACLVAHGIRTGYLVDAVCPPDPMEAFSTLLIGLRRKIAVFEEVMFCHHTPTTQSFLVRVPLLREKISALLGGASECVFIKLDKSPSVSRDLPHTLEEALRDMRSAMAKSPGVLMLPLSELVATELLIPFAGVVIDYPVVYLPAFPTQTSFLEREPLDIYTVSFKWTVNTPDLTSSSKREHAVLKFSCPQVLASSDAELSPGTVTRKLGVKFAGILECVGTSISVTHRTETLERVAL